MTRSGLLALAAVAGVGLSTPAFADWDNIGSIHVDYGADRDTTSPDFGGPVERLQFTATGGDVQCSAIRAIYANGSSSQLFSGMLRQGQAKGVDVPGRAVTIRRLDFACRSFSHGGANIRMDADIGQYKAQWRASPEWQRTWSRMLHWADNATTPPPPPPPMMSMNNWVQIGTAQFSGMTDRDGGAAGWGGRAITELGFKPVNGDAICGRANVRFANGNMRSFMVNNNQPMQRDRLYRVDLPGTYNSVNSLTLRCHALGKYSVSIQIFGNK
ncbi:MAG TPA: hypothetical protein VGG48_14730 [Rhizomicrobium sp.]|jgi:hypothetical protein